MVAAAVAIALGRDVAASASMSALDRQGRALTIGGSASGNLSDAASAASSNQFSLAFIVPGSYAFNYLVGTGIGAVTAVPEASTWLMLLVGMGGMALVARRRGV